MTSKLGVFVQALDSRWEHVPGFIEGDRLRHGHANVQCLLKDLFLIRSRLEGLALFDAQILQPGVEEAVAVGHRLSLDVGIHQLPEAHVTGLGVERDLVARLGLVFDEFGFRWLGGVRQLVGLHGRPELLGLVPGAQRAVEVEHPEGIGLNDCAVEVLRMILSRPHQQQFPRLAVDLVDRLHPGIVDDAIDRSGWKFHHYRTGLRQIR